MNNKNYLKIIAIFMSTLIVMLPVAFAKEYQILYDSNGNIIWDEETDIYRIYNELNQLSETRLNNATGTLLQKYTFDPLLERIFIKDEYNSDGSLKSSTYYFDDDYIVLQNSSGIFNRTNIYQDGVLVGYEDFDGSKKYILQDHLGGTHIVLDESGTVMEENLFSPFAEPLEGSIENPFSYEAKEYDSLVQDYDFHFRKYLPHIRIYGVPDTLLQNVYDPQSLNRFSFERSNPYGNVDEDGHIWWWLVYGGCLAINYVMVNVLSNPVTMTRTAGSMYVRINKPGVYESTTPDYTVNEGTDPTVPKGQETIVPKINNANPSSSEKTVENPSKSSEVVEKDDKEQDEHESVFDDDKLKDDKLPDANELVGETKEKEKGKDGKVGGTGSSGGGGGSSNVVCYQVCTMSCDIHGNCVTTCKTYCRLKE